MLKKVIKCEGYDGQEIETTAYFNLTKVECVELNMKYEADGGLIERLKKLMTEQEDGQVRRAPAFEFIKMLVDSAYGVRPKDDPNAFLKVDENGVPYINKFKTTPFYDAYVFGLLSGSESLDEFSEYVLPRLSNEQMDEAKKLMEKEGLPAAALHEV